MSPQSEKKVYQGSLQPNGFPPLPQDWTSDWETFPSSDGILQLFAVTHHPQEWKGHRALIILHGLGEHGGRYLHFPHYLQDTVSSVYCLDHRGHGRSEGLRGHVERFDAFADDVALAVSRLNDTLTKRFGKSEIHLLGHSMGGLIALRTLLKHPNIAFASVSISAPLLKIRVELPATKRAAAHLMSRIWGSFHMTSDLDASLLSHNKDVVEAYTADRLVHKKGTPRFYTELQAAMADTLKKELSLQIPLQMLIPLQDQIVDPQTSLQFFRGLKLRDKLLKTYPDFFHEPFNETDKDQVFEDLKKWIKTHSMT